MGDIFKAYDVRGIYPTELDENRAYLIAKATVKSLGAKKIVVGQDERSSSPGISEAVVRGAVEMGCDVIYIGQTTTPIFYFTVNHLQVDGGIMITASHNPIEYGGLKIVGRDAISVGLENGLAEIRDISNGEIGLADKRGNLIKKDDALDNYVSWILDNEKIKPGELDNFNIVIDIGDGPVFRSMKRVLDAIRINYTNLGGRFLSGKSPNPYRPSALDALIVKINNDKFDFGISLDLDGDRLAIVSNDGMIVSVSSILAMLWQQSFGLWSKPKIVYTANMSKNVVRILGHRGIISKIGRVAVANSMRGKKASLGAENSGHIFFKEANYSECPEMVIIRLLKVLKDKKASISEVIKTLSGEYVGSGEIAIATDKDWKDVINIVKSKYSNGKISELDGVSIDFNDWWFNLRSSNTEPLMRLFVEAKSGELLNEKKNELINFIDKNKSV